MPKFSLIIPTHCNPNGLFRLLSSLSQLEEISHAEILVVSNPTGDFELQKALQDVNLNIRFFECERGVNRARNLGLNESRGDLLFFLDDDCWISQPDFLKRHEAEHAKNPDVFAIGGFYKVSSRRSCDLAYAKIQNDWLKQCRLNGSGESRSLLGGHFSLKKSMSVHFFDESIIYGGAETEYFIRLHDLGFRFLLIGLAVEHEPNVTYFSLFKKAYLQGKTRRRFAHVKRVETSFLQNKNTVSLAAIIYQIAFHRALPERGYVHPRVSLFEKLRRKVILLHQTVCFYIDHRSSF